MDDLQCMDVLALLSRVGSAPSSSASTMLPPLLNIAVNGPPLAQIAALRLCSQLLPVLPAAMVDAAAKSIEFSSRGDSFMGHLLWSVGDFMNVWMRRGNRASFGGLMFVVGLRI